MAWRETFMLTVGPGILGGTTLGRWLRFLRDNRYAVDPPYWGRALSITSAAITNSLHARREERLYGQQIREAKVYPPLFILGIWRSGTTHLHNLLAQDDRLAFASNYQTCYPLTFLTTEASQARLVDFFLPATRPQDNIPMKMGTPQEDEFAICVLNGLSFCMNWTFPRTGDRYRRYLSFRDASESEIAEWKEGLRWFIRKLSFKLGKPLVLKSPGHTARIKLLLELYPDAKFVHIHRNPYDVHRSTRHLVRAVLPWVTLQRPDLADLEAKAIPKYKETYDAFFEERPLIPPGHFHELAFEDLEADPMGQIRTLYERLSLPDFGHVEPRLREYLGSVSDYKKNEHPGLPIDLKERLAREWQRCFKEWGYLTEIPKIEGPMAGLPVLDQAAVDPVG